MAKTAMGAPYPAGTDHLVDGDDAIKALAEWASAELVKAGRVDRAIEGNGYLRLTPAECFFPTVNQIPISITAIGINEQFRPTWNGSADGGGALLTVYKPDNTAWGAGSTVAIYYAAYRRPE
jgi:hypothetical protein